MSFIKQISKYIAINFILLISYIIYNIIDILEIRKIITFSNNENCKIIRGAIGVEDFARYDDNFFIGISNDNLKLWELREYGFKNTKNGTIITYDIESEKFQHYKIFGFPENISFHPHGIYLYKNNFLYIINHAYSKGGERIEVIKIKKKNGKFKFINFFLINFFRFHIYLQKIIIITTGINGYFR